MTIPRVTHISAFDLDHTLIRTNCAFHFGAYLCRKRYRPSGILFLLLIAYFLLTIKLLSISRLHKLAFKWLFKGVDSKDVAGWVEEYLKEYLNLEQLYTPAVERLKAAKANGDLTLILSSSPSFLVEPIAKFFEVDDWYATVYSTDHLGKYAAIDKIVLGEDKAAYMRSCYREHHLTREAATAYSDSSSDLAFLDACGNAVGVNPDWKLRRLCQKKRWVII